MSRGSGATVLPDPPDGDARLREVGGAATWTVSTAKVCGEKGGGGGGKEETQPRPASCAHPTRLPPSPQPGNGVDLLRDGRTDTYWQSDGNPPHLINIQFQRKVRACERGEGGGEG